jgi:polysaccharide deacetylase 2 family uncharacterized protein YibQ
MASGRKKSKSKKTTLPRWQVTALIFAAVVVLAGVIWYLIGNVGLHHKASFDTRLMEMARERGISEDAIVRDDPIRKAGDLFVRTWRFTFTDAETRDGFLGDLEIEGNARKADILYPEELGTNTVRLILVMEDLGEAFDLHLTVEGEPTGERPPAAGTVAPTPIPTPAPPPDARGDLAILLDDVGQKFDLVPKASKLPKEVGFAILPFLPKSSESAVALHKAGHEIWLHLPMEPENYPANDPGPGALLVSMTPDELRTTLHSAINNIPHVVGVNNHMGSKATADLKMMTWIMQDLKSRGLAFIDSRTTVHTVAEEAARAQGVPTNRRHVFLDNERKAPAIRAQLNEAAYRSRMEGEIIAIGHLDPVTVGVLTKQLPAMSERGVDLVKPSDLVR